MDCPQKCVVDANVLIHLYKAGILQDALSLPLAWVTPDAVIDEIEREGHESEGEELKNLGVQVVDVPGRVVDRALFIAGEFGGLSATDSLVLALAEDYGAPLVTGDGPLRRAANKRGHSFKGVLWIFDLLVEREKIDMTRAREALLTLMKTNARLPERECQKRIEDWMENN